MPVVAKKRGRPLGSKTKPKAVEPPVILNRYDAAGMGRRMKGWNPPSSGPNKAITGLQNIRNRSRDIVRNDWAGKSGVRSWTTNLIGTGIVARFNKITDKAKKILYRKLRDDWARQCDADGVLNEYGQQTLATKSWLTSGEVFARLRYRRPNSGLAVPLQVQLIESDQVPLLDADTWPGMPSGHRLRSGIELNRIGQRVAIWMYREHPGDEPGSASISIDKLVRVSIEEMIHVFEPERPGQLRGVPDFASVITRLRNVGDFDDAVLDRQKIANLFTLFVTKMQVPGGGMADVDPLTGQFIKTDSSGMPMVGLEPGTAQELLPGEDVKFSNPPEAGTTYSDYMRSQHLGTAAGQGLPYEVMSGDIKEVSDRTLRVIMNEFRRYAEQRQWQVLIPMWCQKINDAWVDAGVLSGAIAASDAEALKAPQWAPQGWAYIHPVQDVQAKQTEVEAGFRSRSSVIAERGDDPELVDEERAADKEREELLDIAPLDPQQDQPGGAQDGDGIAPGEYPRNQAIVDLTNSVSRLESFVHAKASEPRNESPQVTVNAYVQPPQVHVQNTVEPAPVNPTPVHVDAPVVNVAAPDVTVDAPVVNVAAPSVAVTNQVQPAEVTVNLPDRKTTSEIVRDSSGNIVNVTQTETTLQ